MAVLIAYLRELNGTPSDGRTDIEAQREAVRGWARRRRHQVVGVIEEDEAAQDLRARHGLAEVLAALHQGVADGVVVYRLDHLDDDLVAQEQLLAELQTAGGRVYSVAQGDTPQLRRIAADPSRQAVREVLRA